MFFDLEKPRSWSIIFLLIGMIVIGMGLLGIFLIKEKKLDTKNNQQYFGSIIFFVGLPPRNVLICYATLDRMEKQCCSFITDGEELKNNLLFLRQAT